MICSPGREVTEFSQFRVTRHSDMALDEEDVRNLRTALRQGLQQRHYGQAVRLEVSAGCSAFFRLLLEQFALPPATLFRVPGPVNLVRLSPVGGFGQRSSIAVPALERLMASPIAIGRVDSGAIASARCAHPPALREL